MNPASAQTIINAPQYGPGDGLVVSGAPHANVEIRTSVVGDVVRATLQFEPTRESAGVRVESPQATITNRGFAAGRVGILATVPLAISNQAGQSFVGLRVESAAGREDFNAQPRFLIQPIQALSQTAAQFYSYNTPANAPYQFNYNGPGATSLEPSASLVPNVRINAANLFFLDALDGRGLVSVFGRPRGNSTTATGLFGGSVRVSGGASSSLAVSDDTRNLEASINRNETTCEAPCSASPWTYNVYTGWTLNNNDGFVILYDKNGAIVDFRATEQPRAVDRIAIFDATSLDPNGAPIIVLEAITPGQRLRFEEFAGGVVHGIDAGVRFTGASGTFTNTGIIIGGVGVDAAGDLRLDGGTGAVLAGSITGTSGPAIRIAGRLASDVRSLAALSGATAGIEIADLDGFRIVNGGIIAGGSGPGAQLDGTGTLVNEASGLITSTSGLAVRGTGRLLVDNAGTITGAVALGGGNDMLILRPTGEVTGIADGGAGRNALQIEAGAAGRSIASGRFVSFQTIDLNRNQGTGLFTLTDRAGAVATLDAGPDGRVALHQGALSLRDSGSSIRAGLIEIAVSARLSGHGEVIGDLTVRGMVSPGNSIGLLTVVGNYVQTGAYEVEFRPVPLGRSRGRNLADGTAGSLAEQDADLILVRGTATLTGGTLVPVALGTAAQFAAARAASPTGELRYLVLRAQGGLGGTRYATLSNIATVRTEYLANGTDVELVVSGTPGGIDDGGDDRPVILLVSAPPPALPARDGTLRQWGLSQNSVLFDLAADCDRPIGLSAAARDESWCSFGQGRLLTASGEGSDGLSVYGGAWSQSGLGQSRLRVADAATGVMRRVGDEAWLGMAVGYGLGWFDFGGAGGDVFRTSFNALQLAGLGRWASGPLELRGMLGYGWSEVESRRPSGLRGGDPRLVADYDLQQATVAGEARWWFGTRGDLALAPTLRLTGARQWRGGYSEEGTSADRFTAQQATWDSLRMALGVTGEIGTSLYGTPLVVEPRLGWVRELGDRAVTVTGTYAGAPGVVMSGTGGPAPRDSAVMGLAGIAQLTGSTRLRLGYDGSWYEGGSSHSLTMRLSYAW